MTRLRKNHQKNPWSACWKICFQCIKMLIHFVVTHFQPPQSPKSIFNHFYAFCSKLCRNYFVESFCSWWETQLLMGDCQTLSYKMVCPAVTTTKWHVSKCNERYGMDIYGYMIYGLLWTGLECKTCKWLTSFREQGFNWGARTLIL